MPQGSRSEQKRKRIIELMGNGENLSAKQVAQRVGISASNVSNLWAQHCKQQARVRLRTTQYEHKRVCDSCLNAFYETTAICLVSKYGESLPVMELCGVCLHALWLHINTKEQKRIKML